MNETLGTLANAYLDNGTGSIMLYYDFSENQTGVTTGDSSTFSADFEMTDSVWSSSLISAGGVPEIFELWNGTSQVSSYTLSDGDSAQDIEDGLDPVNSYGLGIAEGASTIASASLPNTGTIQFARVYYFNGVDQDSFNEVEFAETPFYHGSILNTAPSSTVGSFDGTVVSTTGSASASAASAGLQTFFLSESSGVDLTYSNIKYGSFSGAGFLPQSGLDSEVTFLFSFTKVDTQDGVLFGSLRNEYFNNGDEEFPYGRGFNIGVNDRNKLFFQGIDSEVGEYVITANDIELANKNICSVKVSPYDVTFGYYNLSDDEFQEQNLRTDSKIQNIDWAEDFKIGCSPTYYKGNVVDPSFSGYIDQFLILSGSYNGSDLKSLSSGFVATGVPVSGVSFQDEVITGQDISLVYTSGITGYEAVLTGYESVTTASDLLEFVLVENTATGRLDGSRFVTGYTLGSDSYVEDTSFLIKEDLYATTGSDAFATLGLTDKSGISTFHTLSSSKIVGSTGTFPLYDVQPLTGLLSGAPTGYSKTTLSTFIDRTGSLIESLNFIDGVVEQYRHDYRYYLSERI